MLDENSSCRGRDTSSPSCVDENLERPINQSPLVSSSTQPVATGLGAAGVLSPICGPHEGGALLPAVTFEATALFTSACASDTSPGKMEKCTLAQFTTTSTCSVQEDAVATLFVKTPQARLDEDEPENTVDGHGSAHKNNDDAAMRQLNTPPLSLLIGGGSTSRSSGKITESGAERHRYMSSHVSSSNSAVAPPVGGNPVALSSVNVSTNSSACFPSPLLAATEPVMLHPLPACRHMTNPAAARASRRLVMCSRYPSVPMDSFEGDSLCAMGSGVAPVVVGEQNSQQTFEEASLNVDSDSASYGGIRMQGRLFLQLSPMPSNRTPALVDSVTVQPSRRRHTVPGAHGQAAPSHSEEQQQGRSVALAGARTGTQSSSHGSCGGDAVAAAFRQSPPPLSGPQRYDGVVSSLSRSGRPSSRVMGARVSTERGGFARELLCSADADSILADGSLLSPHSFPFVDNSCTSSKLVHARRGQAGHHNHINSSQKSAHLGVQSWTDSCGQVTRASSPFLPEVVPSVDNLPLPRGRCRQGEEDDGAAAAAADLPPECRDSATMLLHTPITKERDDALPATFKRPDDLVRQPIRGNIRAKILGNCDALDEEDEENEVGTAEKRRAAAQARKDAATNEKLQRFVDDIMKANAQQATAADTPIKTTNTRASPTANIQGKGLYMERIGAFSRVACSSATKPCANSSTTPKTRRKPQFTLPSGTATGAGEGGDSAPVLATFHGIQPRTPVSVATSRDGSPPNNTPQPGPVPTMAETPSNLVLAVAKKLKKKKKKTLMVEQQQQTPGRGSSSSSSSGGVSTRCIAAVKASSEHENERGSRSSGTGALPQRPPRHPGTLHNSTSISLRGSTTGSMRGGGAPTSSSPSVKKAKKKVRKVRVVSIPPPSPSPPQLEERSAHSSISTSQEKNEEAEVLVPKVTDISPTRQDSGVPPQKKDKGSALVLPVVVVLSASGGEEGTQCMVSEEEGTAGAMGVRGRLVSLCSTGSGRDVASKCICSTEQSSTPKKPSTQLAEAAEDPVVGNNPSSVVLMSSTGSAPRLPTLHGTQVEAVRDASVPVVAAHSPRANKRRHRQKAPRCPSTSFGYIDDDEFL